MTTPPSKPPKRRFIIDCDPGVDDAVALLLAISEAPRLQDQILAVTTVHGNVELPQTTKNAAKTLDLMDVKTPYFESRRISIHPGCASPFIKTDKVYFPWHGVDGLGDAGLPDAESRHVAHNEHAALAMIRLSKEYPGEISLVCLGPLTNLALACKLDEGLPGRVKELLWMGGTTRAKGNVSLTSEFNVHKDPEAAHIVLSSFPKSTMISWEMTEEHTVDWQVMEDFLSKAEASCSNLGRFLQGIMKPFERDRARWTGALICDAVCMAVALDPSIVTEAFDKFVDVELEGKYGRGQTVIDWEGQLLKEGEKGGGRHAPNVRIVDKIDMSKLHAMLLRVVETAAAARAGKGGGGETGAV